MQGFFVLIDAIDRAGSTEPAKIQAALKATDLKPDQLIMGYKGVKFDDKGQNILAAGLVIQLQDGENYVAVWPKQLAKTAPVIALQGLVRSIEGGASVPPFSVSLRRNRLRSIRKPLTCPPFSFR